MSIKIYRMDDQGNITDVGFAESSISAAYTLTGFNTPLNGSAEELAGHARCDKGGAFYYHSCAGVIMFNSSVELLMADIEKYKGGTRKVYQRDKMLVMGTRHTVLIKDKATVITPILIGYSSQGEWKLKALNHETGQVTTYTITDLTPGWE